MVAANDDGGFDLAFFDQPVEFFSGFGALAVFKPADAGRQALEVDFLLGLIYPATQVVLFGEQLEYGLVGGGDVGRVARQGGPAEWPGAATEQRTDEGRHEAGKVERSEEHTSELQSRGHL